MTGQPVDSVVNAGSSLPAPLAAGQAGTQAFGAPEKRIHNQAELDRHDAGSPCHAGLLPSSGLTKDVRSFTSLLARETACTDGSLFPLCMQEGAPHLGVGLHAVIDSGLVPDEP